MPDSKRPLDKSAPRYAAGKMEVKGGTGGITAMCPCGEFLEIYKEDTTFRVRAPESVDPEETNPNAPWVASISDSVGSASPVVARVLLQGAEILKGAMFDGDVDKDAVVQLLHSCKESLVVCEKVAKRVASRVDAIIEEIKSSGIPRDNYGRGLNPFPQVPELEPDTAVFLIHAKRSIQQICRLPVAFLPIQAKDNNFDDLAKTLAKSVGDSAPVAGFVRDNAPGVRYLIDLRNFQEHPKNKKTVIDNFRVMPDGSIRVPMWHVSEQQPHPIREEMLAAVDFLIQMTEGMLIHLVMGKATKNIPFIIEEIDDAKVDPKNPIKYRLSIDIGRLKFPRPASN